MEINKKEQQKLRKFDFFKKNKESKYKDIIKKTDKDEFVIFSLFSLAFVMGCFTSISNSLIVMCYISGLICIVKGALFFKSSTGNISLKEPMTYFIIAAAFISLPEMFSGSKGVAINSSTPITVQSKNAPAIDIYKMVPPAPLEGVY